MGRWDRWDISLYSIHCEANTSSPSMKFNIVAGLGMSVKINIVKKEESTPKMVKGMVVFMAA